MNERLILIPLYLDGASDADGVAGHYVPEAFLLTHISNFVTIAGGSVVATIDVQDDGTDAVVAHNIDANGITELTTPVRFAADSAIEIDLNLVGGTTPTATGEIGLWGYVSE